jgi:hypothetical protein
LRAQAYDPCTASVTYAPQVTMWPPGASVSCYRRASVFGQTDQTMTLELVGAAGDAWRALPEQFSLPDTP